MQLDTINGHLEATTTTRRRVVTTGVKLAYAAPLVAASFQSGLLTAGALQASPPGACNNPGVCNAANECTNQPGCFCFASTSGTTVCIQDRFCDEGGFSNDCSTTACPSGQSCITGSCCGAAVCVTTCGSGGATGQVNVYDVAGLVNDQTCRRSIIDTCA